jgi:hypothetical protein
VIPAPQSYCAPAAFVRLASTSSGETGVASAVATWSHCISRGPASAEPGVVSWFQAVRAEKELVACQTPPRGSRASTDPVQPSGRGSETPRRRRPRKAASSTGFPSTSASARALRELRLACARSRRTRCVWIKVLGDGRSACMLWAELAAAVSSGKRKESSASTHLHGAR